MMTRLYSYVCALHVCVYSSTYCKDSGYTCDCYFLCSSEHFAKVQFATISITFVKATGQSNKLLRLASCVSLSLSLSLSTERESGSCSYQSCKQKDLGSIPLQLSFPALQKGCGLWRLSCHLVPHS